MNGWPCGLGFSLRLPPERESRETNAELAASQREALFANQNFGWRTLKVTQWPEAFLADLKFIS
jgi:hypothetical protein